jgi:thiamine biosynthesis lipoprotein
MNRRDFLRPRHLASAAGHAVALLEEFTPASAAPQEAALLHFARRAMATRFEVILPFGTPRAAQAAEAALDEIGRLEAQLSVYRDTSEMSRLNQFAPYTALRAEDGLFELLCEAKTIHEQTAGAYDISAGALIKAWGFFRGPARVPLEEERARALGRTGMAHVILDRSERTVRYLKPGLEINLGSIGKGYALDRAAAILRDEWDISSALLHGGHSSILAVGTPPGQPRGWQIALGHPWNLERKIATIWLRDEAMGTSSATFRHLEHEGRMLGHILDPRTGWPAEGTALATTVAPTAARADALATALFILGAEGTRAYCDAHPEIGAALLPEGEHALLVTMGARR